MVVIDLNGFALRPWQMEDAEDLARYANSKSVSDFLSDAFPYPYTLADAKQFLDKYMYFEPVRAFAIQVGEEACGSIGIFPQEDIHRKNAEIAYWLGEPFWGNGIMSSAIREIIKYGFQTWDIMRIFARPLGNNIASCRALEKAGMKLEARFKDALFKNGKYIDELVYAIRR